MYRASPILPGVSQLSDVFFLLPDTKYCHFSLKRSTRTIFSRNVSNGSFIANNCHSIEIMYVSKLSFAQKHLTEYRIPLIFIDMKPSHCRVDG